MICSLNSPLAGAVLFFVFFFSLLLSSLIDDVTALAGISRSVSCQG